MTASSGDKQAPADGLVEFDLPAHSSDPSARGLSTTARYHFNLTDGETMIRDEQGVEASSVQAAVLSAMNAVEELRADDETNSEEWQGWRLEVVDASGRTVHSIPLDALPIQ